MAETYTWDTTRSVPILLTDGTHAYIYGPGSTPLAQINLTDNTVTYLHADLIGSVRTATDAAGQVACDADYDTYGKPVPVTSDPCGDVTRFGYAGEYTDPSGLIYLRARYYDPASGQFLTLDPLIDTTRNPYGYTAGNPLQFVDPLGLDWWQDAGDWTASFGDTLTFGGTKQIRILMGTDDTINTCSVFYEWGGHGGQLANVGLAAIGIASTGAAIMQRISWAVDTMSAAEASSGVVAIATNSAAAAEGSTAVVRSLAAETAGASDASLVWPTNNGFHGSLGPSGNPGVTVLKPGTLVDRFGLDGGRFVAPNGTPIGARSLAPGTTETPYSIFEVTNRLVVQHGPAEPWFGQPGMGTQYRLPAPVSDLLDAGYLRRVN